jgi:hypothetical protein
MAGDLASSCGVPFETFRYGRTNGSLPLILPCVSLSGTARSASNRSPAIVADRMVHSPCASVAFGLIQSGTQALDRSRRCARSTSPIAPAGVRHPRSRLEISGTAVACGPLRLTGRPAPRCRQQIPDLGQKFHVGRDFGSLSDVQFGVFLSFQAIDRADHEE